MTTMGRPDSADERLSSLLARHWSRVGDIRIRLEEAGFSSDHWPTWDELQKVKVRSKSSLMIGHHSIIPDGLSASVWFTSPGGLIEPLIVAAVDRLAEQLSQAGFLPNDKVLNGFSYHFTPAGLLFHQALLKIGAQVLPIGPQQTMQAAEFACRAGATAFVGIASHLRLLMEQMEALPKEFKRPTIRLALAGAEPFAQGMRQEMSQRWGIQCFDLYGTAESGVVALGCESQFGLHLHRDVMFEVLDPHTGERIPDGVAGEFVMTLEAQELPLLRFATGDLVRLELTPCSCGQRSPRLLVLGRVDESARVKGMLLHANQLKEFAKLLTDLAACNLTVTRIDSKDKISVRWRGDTGCAPISEQRLAKAFKEVCLLRADEWVLDESLETGSFVLTDARQLTQDGINRLHQISKVTNQVGHT
jgi:phenylacetate-CoA ligase